MSHIYSVEGVTAYIRELLDHDPPLQNVWVSGEVSNMRAAASGHWYFTIKDARAQLKCVMFRSSVQRQIIEPKDGEAVKVHGKISVYEARGEYQLYADEIQAAGGIGDLYLRFEQLKAALQEEGLFDAARKQPLPEFPLRLGVVTSPDAAAFRDVQTVLARRFPLAQVILSPTLVQGTEAPPLIVRAIERLNRHQAADVILLCRGGGSIEDLWAFNDEQVARAIAASTIPLVSGIGHETDFTIADFVADVRAPTPSAAAELATPQLDELEIQLQRLNFEIQRLVNEKITVHRTELALRQRTISYLSPDQMIREKRQRVDDLNERLSKQQTRFLALLHERLRNRVQALNAANPEALLGRGYAIVTRSDDGTIVNKAADAPPGTGITVRLSDDEIKARVEDKDSHERYKRTLF